MNILDVVVLSAIQAIATFLPVSSMGHTILTRTIFGIQGGDMLFFQAIVYFATALSALVYFSSDIWLLTQVGLRKFGRLPVNKRDETLLYALLFALIPSCIVGFSLDSFFGNTLTSPFVVATGLVAGSLFFIYAEWIYQSKTQTNIITKQKGFRLGLLQTFALLPGMSRFGTIIAGGMLFGLSRVESARFAFLLSVPLLASFGVKKFLEGLAAKEQIQWILLLVGASVAFVVGLLAVRFMIRFLQNHSLWLFIWYRIILAGFVIFVTLFS